MGLSLSEASPSYELPHALSPDQDTTSGLFMHQRLVSKKTGLPIPEVTAADTDGFSLGLARSYSAVLDGALWLYEGETWSTRAVIAYWPQYDLVITMSANSAVADAEDKLEPIGLVSVFAALKDTGAIAANQ